MDSGHLKPAMDDSFDSVNLRAIQAEDDGLR